MHWSDQELALTPGFTKNLQITLMHTLTSENNLLKGNHDKGSGVQMFSLFQEKAMYIEI